MVGDVGSCVCLEVGVWAVRFDVLAVDRIQTWVVQYVQRVVYVCSDVLVRMVE